MATKSFSNKELACRHCGALNESPEFQTFMDKVQVLRDAYGKPLKVTSAYRCPKHPIESLKVKPGQHSVGAIDLAVRDEDAYDVLKLAFDIGFTGIGVNQKGDNRFIHIDLRKDRRVWSY